MSGQRFEYLHNPITSIGTLSRVLNVTTTELLKLAETAERGYYETKQTKKDGTPRICFDAKPRLKLVHDRIKIRILRKVLYPSFVSSASSDHRGAIDYLGNAAVHSNACFLANEDISSFFPSVQRDIIFDIWNSFFRFSEPVAELLTILCTLRGVLPQGAKTSQHLANLCFWRVESSLVARLAEKGIRYTRWVDDITISSKLELSQQIESWAISSCIGMISSQGLSIKRKKHRLHRAGDRMEVTGAIVGKAGASIPEERRNRIRAAVHHCEQIPASELARPESNKALQRAASLVGQLRRVHPGQALKLEARLRTVREKRRASMAD